MKRYPLIAAIVATMTILSILIPTGFDTSVQAMAAKAFPGAVGFGSETVGGRGGKVIYVSNLNDSGSGSLREALSASGPRTVVFNVAGTINLNNDLEISQPYVTVAGQTACGKGVQVKGGMLKITTHDVIIRYLKVREGNPAGGTPADTDSISIAGNRTDVYNVIVDHSTLVWGTDIGGLSILTNAHDVTVQDSIIGEGLYTSTHPESPHSTSLNLTQLNDSGYPTRITLYRNLITSSDTRNPQIIQADSVDLVNNVIYNWGAKSAYGNPKSLNLVNNYYIKGPLSRSSNIWDLRVDVDYPTQNNNAVFEAGNVAVGFTGTRGGPASIYISSPRFTTSVSSPMSAQSAYNYVVANAGAIIPARDEVDQRIINNVTSRSMTLPNGASGRFVNSSDLVWPNLSGSCASADNDKDGMPESWEQQYFGNTNRGSAANSSSDADNDGFTDLEEYLNGTHPAEGGSIAPTQPAPTGLPTSIPTGQPTVNPTSQPTIKPTITPTVVTTTRPMASTDLVYTPSDDATVEKEAPKNNYGTSQQLTANENPNIDFYVKFKVSGINGLKVTKAVLRFYSVDGSDKGGRVKLAANDNWNEGGISWKARPDTLGDVVASLGQVKEGSWYELDVTSAVKGDGLYSFVITSPSRDRVSYSSKEGSNPPQLVISLSQ